MLNNNNTLKSYCITDPNYYTNDIKIFEDRLNNTLLKNNIDMICLRDKNSSNIEELSKIFIKICKKYNIKDILINTHLNLAVKHNYQAINLNSNQFDKIKEAKKNNLKTIISCHNKEDIKKAISLKANMVTYSPIFNTPNKSNIKGIKNLDKITKEFNIKIIALGGITTQNHINDIKTTSSYGFASIRYFI